MDSNQGRMTALIKRTPMSSLLQHMAYDPGTSIYTLINGNVGFMFELSPFILAGDDVADKVLTVLNKETIPDNTMVSFAMWAGHDIRPYMNAHKTLRQSHFKSTGSADVDEALRSLAAEQADYIGSHTDSPIENLYKTKIRDTRLFCSFVIKTDEKKKKEIADEDNLIELYNQVHEGFHAAGLNPQNVDPDALRVIMGTILNWTPEPSWKDYNVSYDDKDPIRDQILDLDTELVKQGKIFRLNDRYVSVLSADKLPPVVSLSQSYNYLIAARAREAGIKDNVLITTNIYFENQKKERASIKRWRGWANKQNIAPFNKINPDVTKVSESYDLLFDSCVNGSDRPCRMMFSVAVFAETEERAKRSAQSAITHFKNIPYTLKEEQLIGLPVFLSMLPLNASPDPGIVNLMGRFKTCTTANAARVIPACAEWKGVGRPVSLMVGRTGQIIAYNPFDNSTNYNTLLMAESGSGKSVLTNQMIADILSCGGRVIVVDQGYSYENACEIFGGNFLTFDEGRYPNLNPFPFIVDFEEEVDFLLGIVVTMANIKTTTPDGIFQVASLRQLLKAIWDDKGNSMLVDDIVERTKDSQDKRISDLAVLLHAFTKEGEYGKYYSSKEEPIDFNSSRLLVLELDALKNKSHLLQVVVLQMILLANNYIYNKHATGDKSWTMMVIDEAWKFIAASNASDGEKNPILEFVLTAYRQFRKHNASIMLVTQSLNDVYLTPSGAAIAENAGNRIYMGQKQASITQMFDQGRITLDPFWKDQLISVETKKGIFSEMFFDTSVGKGLARLILSPFSLILFSTDMNDRSAIREYRQKGYSIIDSAKLVLRDRGFHRYQNVAVGAPDPSRIQKLKTFDKKPRDVA